MERCCDPDSLAAVQTYSHILIVFEQNHKVKSLVSADKLSSTEHFSILKLSVLVLQQLYSFVSLSLPSSE